MALTRGEVSVAAPAPPTGGRARLTLVLAGAALVAAALAVVHATQGTSGVGWTDLVGYLLGERDPQVEAILQGSRLPRLAAAVLVGSALGLAGAVLQSITRNALATPDTLAVNAGAHLAVTTVAAFGIATGALPLGGSAFLGGLAAAAVVLGMSGRGIGTSRLVLAGSALMLALHSLTMVLIILFEEETKGLYAWGAGSLSQSDSTAVSQMAPWVVVAAVALILMASRFDVLALGDDTATLLGLKVRRTKVSALVLTVLLSAAAVTIAGPVGFVGLCAPAMVRLTSRAAPAVLRHRVLLPASALTGVALVLGADISLRAVIGADQAVSVPTGVLTSIVGAGFLVVLARRGRDSSVVQSSRLSAAGRTRRVAPGLLGIALGLAVAVALTVGLMLGDRGVLLGDLANWVGGRTGPALTFVLDHRLPRVLAAVLAGAALAVAGAVVQGVARNPLAEPSLLGITAGAGVGAIIVISVVPLASVWLLSAAAAAGAIVAFAFVYLASYRGGLESTRLVLIGFGVSAALGGVITLIIVLTDPWNVGKALTWLSGSTYGRVLPQVVPVAVLLVGSVPILVASGRRLDLVAVDEDTPRLLGITLERHRLALLAVAALLTSAAVVAIGVVGFVGLVAPHLARSLVGGRHAALVPVAALIGALLVSVADTVGRTVIAPAQIPAGLITALIGTPYFVWLLWRSRNAS
jgi:iron complex transport system permease protein